MTPLYARALGADFDALPGPIRALHQAQGRSVWRGRASTRGAAGPGAALLAWFFGFPGDQADCAIELEILAGPDGSKWTRRFGGRPFSSRLSHPRPGGLFRERFGAASMDVRLTPDGGRLVYSVQGWRLGPLPMPRALGPSTLAHEEVDANGRFAFDVEIRLPFVGRLAGYRGWLERVA